MDARSGKEGASHPLWGLFLAQFLGAFNDNAWTLLVALLAIDRITSSGGSGPALERAAQAQATLAFVFFTLPLMLVSLPAGVLADRINKRTVIIGLKTLEVLLMTAGTMALLFDSSGGVLPLAVWALTFPPENYTIGSEES